MNRRQSRKKIAPQTINYQALETRRCLAGNVTVAIEGSTLFITGDSEANEILIAPAEAPNRLTVSGVDTTVNGSEGPVNLSARFRTVHFQMGGGDDSVTASGLTTERTLNFFGDEGNDQFNLTSGRAKFFHANMGEGNDTLNIGRFVSDKSTYLYLQAGNDIVAAESLIVGRNLKVFGGEGDDSFVTSTLDVGRKFKLNLDDGNDTALFTGRTDTGRKAKIDLGAGNDNLSFDPQNSNQTLRTKKLKVFGGDGDDNILLTGDSNIRRKAKIDGGAGNDNLQNEGSFTKTPKIVAIEGESVNLDSVRDALFERMRELNIDTTVFGDEVTENSIDISTSSTNLEVTEGDSASLVDDALALTSIGTPSISEARVSLEDFDADQDTIAFTDTDAITGQIDANTGTLTLTPATGSSGTLADFQTALRSVTYQNTSISPNTNERTFNFEVVTDEETFTATRNLSITEINSPPSITLSESSRLTDASELPFILDALLELEDVDNEEFASASVTFIDGYVDGTDELSFTAVDGITSNFDATTGTLNIAGSLTQTNLEEFFRNVTFDSSADEVTGGDRVLRFSVNDGTSSATADFTLTIVVAVN